MRALALLLLVALGCRDMTAPDGAWRIDPQPIWQTWHRSMLRCVIEYDHAPRHLQYDDIRWHAFPGTHTTDGWAGYWRPETDVYIGEDWLGMTEPLRQHVQHEMIHVILQRGNSAHDWPVFACQHW